jgi:hypothetical protein
MTKLRRFLAGALGLALVAGGVGAGVASNGFRGDDQETTEANEEEGNDSEAVVTGTDAERASAAALAHVEREYAAGGRVTEVETGDDGGAYGVEVLLPDGRQIEVHVDADFAVIGDEVDDE